MQPLTTFLIKLESIDRPLADIKTAVQLVVKSVAKIELTPKQIDYQRGVIFLHIRPALRAKLFIEQEEIKAKLGLLLGKRIPRRLV